MHVLMVLTSHSQLGDTGEATGFWLEEFAAPFYTFEDAGAKITLASPAGGQPPVDPKSIAEQSQTEHTRRFEADVQAKAQLANTLPLSGLNSDDYDAIFYAGGHGPLWDLYADTHSIRLIQSALNAGKVIAAVCHAPAVLLAVKNSSGESLLQGIQVTGFSNSEEAAVGLTEVVPYLLEDALQGVGARYSKGPDWQPYVTVDGPIITGQNPASSVATAQALLSAL